MLLLFRLSVMSDSLQPHGLQHARLPCPSPFPGVCPNPWPSSRWCHLTISSSVTLFSFAFSLSQHQGHFQWVGSCIRWPNYQGFSFSIGPSSEYSGLISSRIDWFDLLAVQGTLKNLLQHHNAKASVLLCSVSFMVQLSYPYMTIRKTIALTIQAFVGKVMSLLFNAPSRIAITLISGLQNYTVTLEPKKRKSVTDSICPHLFALKWWDWMPWS